MPNSQFSIFLGIFVAIMEIKEYNVVVIGGGAAGLMAAGTAAMNGNSVLLLEKMEKTGRKVRISGKGRCNLTNVCTDEEFLAKVQNGAGFFTYAYTQWGNRALMRFMERKGVKLETERGGRVFPKSGKAWDIAQALVDWCRGYHRHRRQGTQRHLPQ